MFIGSYNDPFRCLISLHTGLSYIDCFGVIITFNLWFWKSTKSLKFLRLFYNRRTDRKRQGNNLQGGKIVEGVHIF